MGLLRHSLAAASALALAPAAGVALALRPEWRAGWRERVGAGLEVEPGGVWVHAASVGEMLAALPLVESLEGKGLPVHVSSMTATGRAIVRARRPTLPSRFAPLDHPWCVDAALSRTRPRLIVLVETELWPVWISSAAERGIPVVVVSARLSDRAHRRYSRLGALFGPMLGRLAAVGARSPLDAERFVSLGVPEARVRITGDLKRAVPSESGLAGDLADVLGDVPLLVAGSTHPGEEEAALAALDHCQARGHSLALVLAPRHLERVEAVEAQVRSHGRVVRRRSRLDPGAVSPGQVLLLDTLGELPGLYGRAVVAFVGGTLVPVGGHNLLEPLAAACPVLFGPHVDNVLESAKLALDSGGGQCVESGSQLGEQVALLLSDAAARRSRGEAGRVALGHEPNVIGRSTELILEILASVEPSRLDARVGDES